MTRIEESSIPEPNSGCWLWLGGTTPKGYGMLRVDGVMRRAHRVSYAAYNDEPIGDLHVLHKCDNPTCVNPDHLFLGTNQDNVDDRVRKGRNGKLLGENNHQAKLSEEDIVAIRASSSDNIALASMYGVSRSLVSLIKRGKRWNHVR